MAFHKRKIKRRRGKGKSNMYFTMDTQTAIISFQETESQQEREDLYNAQIKYAFEKLVENLIFVYGFQNPYTPTKHLQADCVSFLFETIHKWKKEKGTKAFSYFNVVGKNWLIMNAKKRQKKLKRSISFEDTENMSAKDRSKITHHQIVPSADDRLDTIESKMEILRALKAIKDKVHQENEILCIDAIITMKKLIRWIFLISEQSLFMSAK